MEHIITWLARVVEIVVATKKWKWPYIETIIKAFVVAQMQAIDI